MNKHEFGVWTAFGIMGGLVGYGLGGSLQIAALGAGIGFGFIPAILVTLFLINLIPRRD